MNPVTQSFYLPVVAATPANDPPVFYTPTLGPMYKDATFSFQLDVRDPNGHSIDSYEVVADQTTAPGFTFRQHQLHRPNPMDASGGRRLPGCHPGHR